jgi:NADPH2:quinone reductase
MHAIRQHELGGPDVLRHEQLPDPEPGPGQVRVDVRAAGVHLLDTSIRQGTGFGPFGPPELPMIPGREVAGVVDGLGPGADPSWLGRAVVVHLGQASGGYASKAVAAADDVFPLADGTDPVAAVAMVGTGRTALGVLETAEPIDSDVALVTAAAGGLGALLVQALHRAGATVVGVAGGPAKVAVVERLGADVAVDYRQDGWDRVVRKELGDRDVTLALDGVGGAIGRASFELVAPGGRDVLFGYSAGEPTPLDADDLFASGVTVTAAVGPRMMRRPGGIRGLAQQALDELEAGRLTPLVNPPFALADAAAAHRALEARATTGKVVLVP